MRWFLVCSVLMSVLSAFPAASPNGGDTDFEGKADDLWRPEMVKIYEEEELDQLIDNGVQVLRRRGDICLCLFPNENPTRAQDKSGTRWREIKNFRGRGIVPTLDKATGYFGAERLLSGEGLPQAFTGKDVVVGICDIGFDPLHPAFLAPDGTPRVKRITQYRESEGERRVIEGEREYREWITDDIDRWHATHVAGIAAGNGAGTPYAGIARDADIVVSTSQLSDVGLLAGVEDIIDYAKAVDRPVVINMSMGSYTGPHDGTSLFSQYLDMCAEDAVIVLSAGNEGDSPVSLSHTFAKDDDNVSVRLGNQAWTQFDMYGMTDIWSASASPLALQVSIYDDHSHSKIKDLPIVKPTGGDLHLILGRDFGEDADDVFSDYFSGWLAFTGEVNRENGRYNLQVTYDFKSPEVAAEDKPWARYTVILTVYGKEGNHIDIFSDSSYTRFIKASGQPAPSGEMSISDLACGRRVISVGSYNNRATYPGWVPGDISTQSGLGVQESGLEPGCVSAYSSYGTLGDGRVMPVTVAPGAGVISAWSRPYARTQKSMDCSSPWINESGTSMSSPYVAGFIAVVLEAFPHLKAEDLMDYIVKSNRKDYPDESNPRHGSGWFDPYSVMQLAMKEAGVGSNGAERKIRMVKIGEEIEICNLSGVAETLVIYNASGSVLTTLSIPSGVSRVPLPSGLTIVKCGSQTLKCIR